MTHKSFGSVMIYGPLEVCRTVFPAETRLFARVSHKLVLLCCVFEVFWLKLRGQQPKMACWSDHCKNKKTQKTVLVFNYCCLFPLPFFITVPNMHRLRVQQHNGTFT